ncbi:hypothetical protein PCANC_28917 [Puccinia coronata f. sp. avenae]|uniref:Uncharacterized protein n=1 Tax=Puccinia coronata f. sp. avenae TaxID=200324 RepID=A0A2N5RVK7_9BASI|nr:hypothetical protein PCANC_28917 [Puccinia coronata f. sp. avenae]
MDAPLLTGLATPTAAPHLMGLATPTAAPHPWAWQHQQRNPFHGPGNTGGGTLFYGPGNHRRRNPILWAWQTPAAQPHSMGWVTRGSAPPLDGFGKRQRPDPI